MKIKIDDELVRLSKRWLAFSVWTLLMLYSEPTFLSVLFFGIIAVTTWIILLIDLNRRIESKEDNKSVDYPKDNISSNSDFIGKPQKIIFTPDDI